MFDAKTDRFVTVAVTDTNGLLRGQKIATGAVAGMLQNGMGMAPGLCQNNPPCLTSIGDLAIQPCPILYPFATSKPVQRSSNLR